MIGVIVAFAAAFLASLFGTPILIKVLVKKQYGQFIRQDGPTGLQPRVLGAAAGVGARVGAEAAVEHEGGESCAEEQGYGGAG